jgi:hypothetical protein
MTASARIPACLVALVLALAPFVAAAQDGASRLTGRVTDSSGAALPGVTVTLSSPRLMGTFTAVTDGAGQYTFPALPPDTYAVGFELAGFESRTDPSVELKPADIVVLDRQMDVASLAETVEVVGQAPPPPPPPPPAPLAPLRERPDIQPVPPEALASVCGPGQPGDGSATLGHIAAHRDDPNRQLYGTGDVLVIDVGAEQGVSIGQNYVVRRWFRVGDKSLPLKQASFGELTAGIVQVVEAGPAMSTAVVVYACGEFLAGDAIERFDAMPMWTALSPGTPHFEEPARIILGDEGQIMAGPRQLMVIDYGAMQGAQRGQRLTIFRRTLGEHGPVSTIGDAIIVAVRADSATIRIERANDAVTVGDMVALHR